MSVGLVQQRRRIDMRGTEIAKGCITHLPHPHGRSGGHPLVAIKLRRVEENRVQARIVRASLIAVVDLRRGAAGWEAEVGKLSDGRTRISERQKGATRCTASWGI